MHLDFKISFNFTEFWYFTDNENMNVLFTVTGLPHLLISIIHKWISTFDFFFMPDHCCNRTYRKVVLLHSKHFYFIWYLNLKNENVLWTVTGLPWNCPLPKPVFFHKMTCDLWPLTLWPQNPTKVLSPQDIPSYQVWCQTISRFLRYWQKQNGTDGRTDVRTYGRTDDPKT